MDELHPIERAALEEFQRAQWLAGQESAKEFGRLLNAWMKDNGDGILRNWYMSRLDNAPTLDKVSYEWQPLHRIYRPVRDDIEMFRVIAGMEGDLLALDKEGHWLVRSDIALELANARRDRESNRASGLKSMAFVLALLLVVGMLARCA